MIVETTRTFTTPEEGEDILAGWRALDCFMVGYIRAARTESQEHTAVGLFHCTKGDLERTQRTVTHLYFKVDMGAIEQRVAEALINDSLKDLS